MAPQKRQIHLQVETLEDRQLLAAGLGLASALNLGQGHVHKAHAVHKVRARARHRVRFHFLAPHRGRTSVVSAHRVSSGNAIQDSFATGQMYDLPGAPDEIIAADNGLRAQNGLPALTVNPLLAQAAQAHAENMAQQDKYGDSGTDGHILDGHDFIYRLAQVGYQYSTAGENVAYNYGYSDPTGQLISQWFNSQGHRDNILRNTFTETGVGVAVSATGKVYACQLFGAPPAAPAPAPAPDSTPAPSA
jgi:uncharacterized protein YkwD